MRIALGIEYDGSRYRGWQVQPGEPTLQGTLERALAAVAGHEVRLQCAGRTDAAVHATGQVAHFDTMARRAEHNWVFGCNANLPPDIRVLWAKVVADEFHARYSAVSRRYIYLMGNGPVRPALNRQRVAWCFHDLDLSAMSAAASFLCGEHDFSSFRSSNCQSRSPVRRVTAISVEERGELAVLEVTANAFLQHMVRNIAGVLMDIGAGKHPADWARWVLEARDRRKAAATAPAQGLYLVEVLYPQRFALPPSRRSPLVV